MKTPPFLLGAVLLFWGWQTGLWFFAVPMAVVVEAARWIRRRLDLAPEEWRRLWDVTTVLFVAAAIYNYSLNDATTALITFLRWLPLIFFPFMAAQAYSTNDRVGRRTFFWLLRREKKPEPAADGVNVSFPYFALCLFSSSAGNFRDGPFYAGLCVLTAYALWSRRPQRVPAPVTVGLFALVVAAGLVGQNRWRAWQSEVERRSAEWIFRVLRRTGDETEMQTALGRIGELHLSERVVLRVEPDDPDRPPPLLRTVCFNQFRVSSWFSRRRQFRPVTGAGETDWRLLPSKVTDRTVVIATPLSNGRGLLPLPLGTGWLEDLFVGEVERNRLGIVRVGNGPDAVRFTAHYGPGPSLDDSPERHDTQVPKEEEAAVSRIASELKLAGKTPDDVMNTLQAFFEKKFRYTTDLKPTLSLATGAGTPIAKFLLRHRQGHCEYFASAAVLLLRHVGIPARYAVGYAVDDAARDGRTFLVRERHGHAWALAYVNGAWRDFDPTPPAVDLPRTDQEMLAQVFADGWSEYWFKFSLWSSLGGPARLALPVMGILLVLAAVMAWRLFTRKERARLTRTSVEAVRHVQGPGLDSEMFLIEKRLASLGLERGRDETFARWSERVRKHPAWVGAAEGLRGLLTLHYRYRFDPAGLAPEERVTLADQARAWLESAALRSVGSHPAPR